MAARPQPLIAVVVLNTNRREDTLACLASLAALDYARHEVLLLDNASTDGSVAAVRAQFPSVRIHALTDNRGYAGNNNVGIEAAMALGAEWILVLNEDTVLAPTCLSELMQAAGHDSRIGVLGPMVYHHDEPDVIQSAGGILDSHWTSRHAGQNEHDRVPPAPIASTPHSEPLQYGHVVPAGKWCLPQVAQRAASSPGPRGSSGRVNRPGWIGTCAMAAHIPSRPRHPQSRGRRAGGTGAFWSSIWLRSADPAHAWVNGAQFIGLGRKLDGHVAIDAFALPES